MINNRFCKCDKCGHVRQFDNWTFDDILKTIRAAGWRVTMTDKGWRHYCAECVARWKKTGEVIKKSAPPRRQWLPYKDD